MGVTVESLQAQFHVLLQIYPPCLSFHLWIAHHCFRSRNTATVLVYLLTMNILDCYLIKADA